MTSRATGNAARAFGGLARATVGVVGETIFSTLHAPLLMLWHTRFVITNLLGISVGWTTAKTRRRRHDVALRRRSGIGATRSSALVWGVFMWRLDPTLFWWFTPVLAGMVLSIPLSVLTSRRSLGARARKPGIVSDAGGNRAAAGTGLAARAHENP